MAMQLATAEVSQFKAQVTLAKYCRLRLVPLQKLVTICILHGYNRLQGAGEASFCKGATFFASLALQGCH